LTAALQQERFEYARRDKAEQESFSIFLRVSPSKLLLLYPDVVPGRFLLGDQGRKQGHQRLVRG
jgi:hypothetical protein